jgi:1-acyl-sn-glycerol-3-phosphate acyltransferase
MTTKRRRIHQNFGALNGPLRWFSGALLRGAGWRITGKLPEDDKLVAIFAPHTSNWDFMVIYLMINSFGIKGNFFAKHALFWPPLGWFLRWAGAIPVTRSRTEHLVDSALAALAGNERFYLGLAPEGTRRYTDHWRTGFYRIAERADARILLLHADFATRETGLGPAIRPTGDIDADFEVIKAFYEDKTPCCPENRSDAVLGRPRDGQ